jgi:hypothetical protein
MVNIMMVNVVASLRESSPIGQAGIVQLSQRGTDSFRQPTTACLAVPLRGAVYPWRHVIQHPGSVDPLP